MYNVHVFKICLIYFTLKIILKHEKKITFLFKSSIFAYNAPSNADLFSCDRIILTLYYHNIFKCEIASFFFYFLENHLSLKVLEKCELKEIKITRNVRKNNCLPQTICEFEHNSIFRFWICATVICPLKHNNINNNS